MGRSRLSDEELLDAAAKSGSMSQLLRRVGLVNVGDNYRVVRQRLQALGALEQRFAARSPDRPRAVVDAAAPEAFAAALAASYNLSDALRRLGLEPDRNGFQALNDRARRDGHDLSALRRRSPREGRPVPRKGVRRGVPLEDLLVLGRVTSGSVLGRRLVTAGLLQDCCAGCGGTAWQGEPIPLELDHTNGDRTDNRLENLRLLCPNCHALTPTYRGRNVARRAART